MKIGGEYRLRNIGLRHWQRLAAELHVDDANLIDKIRTMAQVIPDQVTTTQEQIEREGLSHVTTARLCRRLKTRAWRTPPRSPSCPRILCVRAASLVTADGIGKGIQAMQGPRVAGCEAAGGATPAVAG